MKAELTLTLNDLINLDKKEIYLSKLTLKMIKNSDYNSDFMITLNNDYFISLKDNHIILILHNKSFKNQTIIKAKTLKEFKNDLKEFIFDEFN